MNKIAISLPEYKFDATSNPYFYDETNPKSVAPIAEQIEKAIRDNFDVDNILVRGVQSGLHTPMTRDVLIEKIIEKGNDAYKSYDVVTTIHASLFYDGVIEKILEAFHVFKPKGEDRPQYPVDVWMIFDKNAYNNIEYMHPRHHVIVRDKWEAHKASNGLLGLVVVN